LQGGNLLRLLIVPAFLHLTASSLFGKKERGLLAVHLIYSSLRPVKPFIVFIFLVMPLAGWCQALAGLWRGHLLVSDSTLDYQLAIAEDRTDRGFGQITFLIKALKTWG
jgi:hypothetical protein